MIEQSAQTCSALHTVLNSFIAGEVGSIGFFINMLLISGAIYLIKTRRVQNNFEAAKKVAADLIRNAPPAK